MPAQSSCSYEYKRVMLILVQKSSVYEHSLQHFLVSVLNVSPMLTAGNFKVLCSQVHFM